MILLLAKIFIVYLSIKNRKMLEHTFSVAYSKCFWNIANLFHVVFGKLDSPTLEILLQSG
jgi:hypothetical protein